MSKQKTIYLFYTEKTIGSTDFKLSGSQETKDTLISPFLTMLSSDISSVFSIR